MKQDEIMDRIDRCLNEGRGLTQWERDVFLPSIEEQLDRVGKLTYKQEDILDRIYRERVLCDGK